MDYEARYRWLLEQNKSAPVADDGSRIFDLKLALPPAKTVEESIELARCPFVAGEAVLCRHAAWAIKARDDDPGAP